MRQIFKTNFVTSLSKILLYLVILAAVLLIPVYYLKLLPASVFPHILLSLSAPLLAVVLTLFFFKKKRLHDCAGRIQAVKKSMSEGISRILERAEDDEILPLFRRVRDLINLNKPVQAVNMNRLALIKLLELQKQLNSNEPVVLKNNVRLPVLELIKIWENVVKTAFREKQVTVSLAENYFTSSFYMYLSLKPGLENIFKKILS